VNDLVYVRRNLRAYQQARGQPLAVVGRDLGSKLWLRSCKESEQTAYYARGKDLYFPRMAGTAVVPEDIMPHLAPLQILPDGYFQESVEPAEGELTWVEFFTLLGVASRPRVQVIREQPYEPDYSDQEIRRMHQSDAIKQATRPPSKVVQEFDS